jgi:hypothetical protein
MSDLLCNRAKGRFVEWHHRVDQGDPADSRLYWIPISAGSVTDAQLRDADTFADMVTLGVTERTANGWNRKTLTASDLASLSPDDTNDRMDVDAPDPVWTSVSTDAVTDLVLCYASVATPTNSQLVPIGVWDFAVSPSGGDVTAQLNAAGYGRAS